MFKRIEIGTFKIRIIQAFPQSQELDDVTTAKPTVDRRINEASLLFGTRNTTLLSIHVNAAGNGRGWMSARGWCAYTFPGKTLADPFSDCLYEAAEQMLPGQKIRKDMSDGDPDFESPFYILRNTVCPAVLTENLFMDNQEDCKFLLSAAGKRAIVGLHVRAICKYLKIYK